MGDPIARVLGISIAEMDDSNREYVPILCSSSSVWERVEEAAWLAALADAGRRRVEGAHGWVGLGRGLDEGRHIVVHDWREHVLLSGALGYSSSLPGVGRESRRVEGWGACRSLLLPMVRDLVAASSTASVEYKLREQPIEPNTACTHLEYYMTPSTALYVLPSDCASFRVGSPSRSVVTRKVLVKFTARARSSLDKRTSNGS